ncbi:MAG: 4-hydroxy-tetrahydrodipicolinate synthase [Pseudomonadota bacterium]
MFKGSIVALITPFCSGGVDEKTLASLVEWQIQQGTQGIVPCGSTGEGMALSYAEKCRVIEICVKMAAGRIPVIASTGLITTPETIQLTQSAQGLGADGALVIVPPYLKPSAEGIYQHFKAVHDATDLPIVIYNHPGRTGVDLSLATLQRLAKLKNIVGLKDASLNPYRPVEIRQQIGTEFVFLSGDDGATLALMAQGGQGAISITANVSPKLCVDTYHAWVAGDMQTVAELRDQLFPLHQALCIESNPTPVKYAASVLGLCANEVRAPLVPITQASQQIVDAALQHAGLSGQTLTLAG